LPKTIIILIFVQTAIMPKIKEGLMADQELSDKTLSKLMKEVAAEAKRKSITSDIKFFSELFAAAKKLKATKIARQK
jgi:hypothetical protein